MERIPDAPWIRNPEPYWNEYYGLTDEEDDYTDDFDAYDEKHWDGKENANAQM